MVNTTRSVFDKQLETLQNDVLRLSEMVESELTDAIRALQGHDLARAQHVDEYDKRVNQYRYHIEEQCYQLLALQQPNSRDMRQIVTVVSVVTNLERMGDYAAGIARLVLRKGEAANAVYLPAFDDMLKMAVTNLREAIQALLTQDAKLAQAVAARDSLIDNRNKDVYDHLIKTMTDNPATVEYATMLLWVSHNLERFDDRITNICERVVYLATGSFARPWLEGAS